jgi:hypothetical protein
MNVLKILVVVYMMSEMMLEDNNNNIWHIQIKLLTTTQIQET